MNTFLHWLFEIRSISSLVDKGSSSAILYIPDGILSLFINSFIINQKLSILQKDLML